MLTVIGCGNENRSDDGAGVAVVRGVLHRLGGDVPAGVRVLDGGTRGVEVMFQARGSRELVLVDASSTGSEPGAVFEVPWDVLDQVPAPRLGVHGFRWDHALYAGKQIFRENFPERVAVYLIEAQTLDFGLGLSPPVRQAVSTVIDRILDQLRAAA